jgi:shikimate kinase
VIVLIGFMGAGKTTAAREVAHALGREHRDADRLLEERFGASIEEVFDRDGEAAFRAAERELVLADAYRAKFGGDPVDDVRAAVAAYAERIGWQRTRALG